MARLVQLTLARNSLEEGYMSNRVFSRASLPALALLAGLLTACVSGPRGEVVYVRSAPPARIVEVEGVAPGPNFVWIGGFHVWQGGAYVWTPGRWAERPHPNARWVAGTWKQHSRGWYWKEGHWK